LHTFAKTSAPFALDSFQIDLKMNMSRAICAWRQIKILIGA